jgi:hypothetical protein
MIAENQAQSPGDGRLNTSAVRNWITPIALGYAVAEVALAVGRLGGRLNRKSDGLPGWITLW